ncbi:SpoIIIAH-like family protein [Alkalibaculum sporogenes]|uniref:SpoIIIAH-like family protein n=1 Tax=Alkalibaculum sporogenes TaxID=2655001 RepID=UPI00128B75E0
MNIFKKKNLVVFSLVGVLALVGYLNYHMLFNDGVTTAENEKAPINAELVNIETENEVMTGTTTLTDGFFVDYKIERDKSRSQSVAMLEDISKEEDGDKDTKTMAQQEVINLVKISEQEMIIENLIRAKGFNDAIVFIHDGYVNVVVDAQQLTTSQAAQIQNIVNKESGVDIEKISIATNNNDQS